MAETSDLPPPPPPAGPASGYSGTYGAGAARPLLPAVLAAIGVAAAGALLGLLGGIVWAHVAPRVLYQVAPGSPREAFVVNSEPTAFFAADGWYCVVAMVGGALLGLLGYLLAVRRYGPVPMAGVLGGSVAAAYLARWLGQRSGLSDFNHLLATSKPGTFLRAPIVLGSQGALAFWPLGACLVVGAIVLTLVLAERRRRLAEAPPGERRGRYGRRAGGYGQPPR